MTALMTSFQGPLPKAESGLESLAIKESKRPRANSEKRQKGAAQDSEIFDSESDVFSILHPDDDEDSTINFESQEGSPLKVEGGRDMDEKDIDDIDNKFLKLTSHNKDFQKLVEEAKVEKERQLNLS